jgi:hypothetical protein
MKGFDAKAFANAGQDTTYRSRPSREIRQDDRIGDRARDRKAPTGPGFIEGVRKVRKAPGYIEGTGKYRKVGC